MFFFKNSLFQISFGLLFYLTVTASQSSDFSSYLRPLTELGFLKKDSSYYQSFIFKNMSLIYSQESKIFHSILSDYVKRANFRLSEDFVVSPYFQKNFIVFYSPRRQIPNALATIYPHSAVFVYPSISINFMDRWSLFNWSQDAIIHELTHIYQFSQNSMLDQFMRRFFGILSYRNSLLPHFILEGSAVFNESFYGSGGRLFSGWARAFVFSQIQEGFSLKKLLRPYDNVFSNIEKYLHGAYFFSYLHSQYGREKIKFFFKESSRYFPYDFYGLSFSLERTFGKNLKSLFKEYKEYYAPLANQQKILSESTLFSSQSSLPINSDKRHLYFLISDLKSQPSLVLMDKNTGEFKFKKVDLPLGKVFYQNGEYLSVGQNRTSSNSIEFSLFREGIKPLKKYNSQHVMDIYEEYILSLDTKNYIENSILLNGVFYDNSHSSALMNHKGQVYYFKQNKDQRVLYRDKEALFSIKTYFAYPVEADEEGFYFISSVRYGSSLFVYKPGKGIFRLSEGDRIAYARKLRKNIFLVAEIHPYDIQYKLIQAREIQEEPFSYDDFFKKENIFHFEKGHIRENIFKQEEILYFEKKANPFFKGYDSVDFETQQNEGIFFNLESDFIPLDKFFFKTQWTNQLLETKKYNPIANLSFYQFYLGPYHNLQFPESILDLSIFFDHYPFLSLFQFTDPMNFNYLDVQSFFGFKEPHQHFLKIRYDYTKYRLSFSFFFNYEKQAAYKNFSKFKTMGFLKEADFYEKKGDVFKLRTSLLHQDISAGLGIKYPLFLKPHQKLVYLHQFQYGKKKFFDKQRDTKSSRKVSRSYFRFKGGFDYRYHKKYSYSYQPYSERILRLLYDAYYIPFQSLFFSEGHLQANWTQEVIKSLFFSWNLNLKKEFSDKSFIPFRLSFKKDLEKDTFFYFQNFQNLAKMDFQLLKVLDHSYYFLQIPFALRRWAPLAGFSLFYFPLENDKTQFLLMPFFGFELEIYLLNKNPILKAGFSLSPLVLNFFKPSSIFLPHRNSINYWLKRSF